MNGRVSIGQELELQEAFDFIDVKLQESRVATTVFMVEQLNESDRGTISGLNKASFQLVCSVVAFDGAKPDMLKHFVASLEEVCDVSRWQDLDRLRVAKLQLTGAVFRFIPTVNEDSIVMYQGCKRVLCERFSDKAHQHCYFQQLSIIQQ